MKRWITVIVIIGALLLSGASYWLLATSAGLRFTLQAVVKTIPLPLTYTNLQGTVLSTIRADSAQYKDDVVTVNIKQFETRFSIVSILAGRVAFSDVKSAETEVVLINGPETEQTEVKLEAAQEGEFVDAGLPIVISLENVQIKTVQVKDGQNTFITVTDIVLVDGEIKKDFSFSDLSFGVEPGVFTATGNIGFAELEKFKLKGSWETDAIENLPATSGVFSASGTYQQLSIDSQLDSPEVISVTGEISDLFSELSWNARIKGSKFPFSIVDASLDTELRDFSFSASGSTKDAKVTGHSELWDSELGRWSTVFDGSVDESKVELIKLNLQSLDSPAMLTVSGSSLENFTYSEMGPLHITAFWEKIKWPITGPTLVTSDAGQLEAKGFVSDYQVQLMNTGLRIEEHEVSNLNATGNGNFEALEIAKFTANYLAGSWQGNGRLGWKNDFNWRAALTVKGANPSVRWPEWTAKLNGKANIKGAHKQDGWQLTGEIKKLGGELAGLPIDHASLDFELAEHVYVVKNLKFKSQQNQLRGNAQFKFLPDKEPRINASWNIDSQNLTQLHPAAKGSIKSEGHLRGDLLAPQLSTSIQAKGLVYKDYGISSIEGAVDVDPRINSDLSVRLRLENLKIGDTKIRGLSLSGNGTTGDHELKYSSRVDAKRSLSWSATGGYKDEIWKGTLNSSLMHTAEFGDWEQQLPSDISVSASRLHVDYYCLTPINADAHVCLKIDSDYLKSWSGAINIKDLPVETFKTYFPPQIISVQGLVNGSANFDFQKDVIRSFHASLVSSKGKVEFGLPAGEKQKLDYQQLQAEIVHGKHGINVISNVDLRETGEVDIKVTLKNKHTLSELDTSQLIDGRIVVDLKNLTVLPLIYPDIQYIDGHKYSEYVISGSIGNPVIIGRTDIAAKSVLLPRLGIELRDVRADARTDKKNNIKVSGEASSGEGKIIIKGEMLNYLGTDLLAKLHIEGNNFLATKTPEFEMEISPKVTAIVNNDVMRLEGNIVLPRARIQAIQTASTVSPSADVVIVDADLADDQARKKLALDAELKITLGNEVSIEGFGASGRLRGEVLVREVPGGVTTGSGEIRFEEGKFTAYNRELSIERGMLTFANSPIDNPILAIQAVRNIDRQDLKVKVGVEVTGQAQNPKVELFSEPAMDQSDILSYMILGYPMNQATEKDGSTLSTAASSIGLIGGELLANEIATKLGIDIENIRITTDAATQQPLVGAYLNPRLYAEYVMGVGQAVNTFRIEYNLTNRWVLKTETSSEQQGADLFYTIEID